MHIAKYKSNQIGQLVAHIQRPDGRNYGNENIDKSKSRVNYALIDRGDCVSFINDRVSEVKHLNRSDVVKLVGFVCTKPKDYKGDEKAFFKAVTAAISERYGNKNIAYAVVHNDESSPHIHIGIIPIVKDKDGREKLCCKELFDKQELQRLHPEIERAVNGRLREPVRLLNNQTERNPAGKPYKDVKELKRAKTQEQQRERSDLPRTFWGKPDYKRAYEQQRERTSDLERDNLKLRATISHERNQAALQLRILSGADDELRELKNDPDQLREQLRELEERMHKEREIKHDRTEQERQRD